MVIGLKVIKLMALSSKTANSNDNSKIAIFELSLS